MRIVNEHIHDRFYTNTYGSKINYYGRNADDAFNKASIIDVRNVEDLQTVFELL